MPNKTPKTRPAAAALTLSAPVFDVAGKELRTVALTPSVFGVRTNPSLVSEVLVSAQANRRHAIADTLQRGEVRGGGKKPWRQKGTGRARQGSTRSPHWRHGGVAFGPTNVRNFSRKINAKARQAVVRMLLSSLKTNDQLRLVEDLAFTSTKQTAQFLGASAGRARRPLLLTATTNRELLRSGRNLSGVMIRSLERLGLLDLALTDQLILDVAALEPLVARYASQKPEIRDQKSDEQGPTSGLRPPTKRRSRSSKPATPGASK